MKITIAERDLSLVQIQEEIKRKKMLLIQKKKNLEKKRNINNFLSEVESDYNRYYSHILKEKQSQHNALLLLKEYMDDLIVTDNLVDEQLKMAKYEQKDIMNEIEKVKRELDEIVE